MKNRKTLMAQVAVLYYKEKRTQQEIAEVLGLTRQTVSKLLAEAVEENVVEIRINNPEAQTQDLRTEFRDAFGVKAIICESAGADEALRQYLVAERGAEYLAHVIKHGGKKLGVAWGRTVSAVVKALPVVHTVGNVVFPLFGATNHEREFFLPNELARELADKLYAGVKYAWFPYRPDSRDDAELLTRTSYYKSMRELWSGCDVALMGVGNNTALTLLEPDALHGERVVGDVATHFFDSDGKIVEGDDTLLRIAYEELKNVGERIAVVSGNDKAEAIIGALKSGLVSTLVTDEYTARAVLEYHK